MAVYLKDILKGIKFRAEGGVGRLEIAGATDDSRKVRRAGLFVAVKGHSHDGRKFIDDAIAKGARAILTDCDFKAPAGVRKVLVDDPQSVAPVIAANFYGHPSSDMKVIGVTGTNGKTTVTYIIESVLEKAGVRAGVIGTVGYRFAGQALPPGNTTPGSFELQSILARMRKLRIGYAVMEVSSHSLDQNRVDEVSFDVAIFTNITLDHLDYHKTTENYFRAKARLFDKLKRRGVAVLNNDDPRAASLKRRIKKRILTYGIESKADVTAKDIKLGTDGSSFRIVGPGVSFNVRTKLIGLYNVSNILAAVAAGLGLGLSAGDIKRGVESPVRVPGRLEPVDAGQGFKVFVDYAHTEDALRSVLRALRLLADGRIITVFGCGGNRDRAKRPLMGRAACELSDHVIITSDNPRFEEPNAIISDIENGIKGRFENYDIEPDRRRAIEKALMTASNRDIVLIAGKGHETYQIKGGEAIDFDDRDVAKETFLRRVSGAKAHGAGKEQDKNSFTVREVVRITGGELLSGDPDLRIMPSMISTDSRTIKEGELFLALNGANFAGDDFAEEAMHKAAGVIVTRPVSAHSPDKVIIKVGDGLKALQAVALCHRKRFDIPIIAVTGTNGKTTTKEMIWSVLSTEYNVLKNEGTKNNHIGVPQTLLKLDPSHDACVLELGTNHKGEIKLLSDIARPTVAVITNIGPSHLEFLGDEEGVYDEKRRVLDFAARDGIAFINGDDEFLSKIRAMKFRMKRFGLGGSNDLRARIISAENGVIKFTVNEDRHFELNLLGAHNVYNALAAIAVGSYFGLACGVMKKALSAYRPVGMRLNVKEVDGIAVINDVYNSNPMSMKAALDALRNYPARSRWVASGDMLELGRHDVELHRVIGRMVAESGVEGLVTFGELSRHTLDEARRSGMREDNLWHCSTHDEIAGILKKMARKGDVVLVKGSRGMRMEKVLSKLIVHSS